MKKIIIYGSMYQTTYTYAYQFSKETKIPLQHYKQVSHIEQYDVIIYFGALYAGGVLGLKHTFAHFAYNNQKIIVVTVGLSDPKDKINQNNIRKNIQKQVPSLYQYLTLYHLRGGIDYSKLSFKHKTMMYLLYKKALSLPKEKQTEEVKALIDTYNQKVSFIDFCTLKPIGEQL